jgi:hypothetical protein
MVFKNVRDLLSALLSNWDFSVTDFMSSKIIPRISRVASDGLFVPNYGRRWALGGPMF